MELLIKQALETIAHLGNDKPVALLSVEDKHKGMVIGGWVKGEFILPNASIQLKGTPLEKIIANKQAHTYPGTVVESLPFPAYKETDSGFSCLCLPLLNAEHNQVKGIVVIAQKRGSPLSSDRLQTLNTIIPLIAVVVAASLEKEHLIELATRDSLTGLYTRHYFETRLQEEFTRIRRHGGVVSILRIDIDHFKLINDPYGSK